MAISISNQYKYTGRGPFDAKSLVKDYATLLKKSNWTAEGTEDGNIIAYNGMITAVWLNKDDTTKNGVYVLFDPLVTTALKKPDVTNEANWHKLAELSDIKEFAARVANIESELATIDERLTNLEKDQVVIRRDNEFNYKKITTPIPNNEICLVDVPGQGLRIKIGDGEKTFTELSYLDEALLKNIDSLIIKGYFYQDTFYTDATHTEQIEAIAGRIYIDAASSKLYTFNGISYEAQQINLPSASATVAGIVKLYDTTGQNIDGTMTQKAITNELSGMNEEINEKFEMLVDKDDELLIFDRDLY